MLHIQVQSLSGQVFDLDETPSRLDVRTFKTTAAKQLCLPAICINFAQDGQILKDDDQLHAVLKDVPEPLILTLFVSLEQVYSELKSESVRPRLAALKALTFVATRDYDNAVAAAISCLPHLELAALETLRIIAQRGDESTAKESLKRLSHVDPNVRCAALAVLAVVAIRDEERAVKAAAACLQDELESVKVETLSCLAQIASRGNKCVITDILEFLEGEFEPTVWRAALKCLSALSEDDLPSAYAGVVQCLKHTSSDVRQFALEFLMQTKFELDDSILERTVTCLKDKDRDVRCVALEALFHITKPFSCDEHVVKSVAACLQDGDCDEKQAAGRVLSHLASVEAWEALAKNMFNNDADVRRAAHVAMITMMGLMGSWKHVPDTIFDSMQPLLSNLEDDVCEPAMEVICASVKTLSLSNAAASSAAKLALGVVGGSSGLAQLQALKTLSLLGNAREHLSGKEIMNVVHPCIRSGDSELCAQACQVLPIFVPRGDDDVVQEVSIAICTCKVEDDFVQLAKALSKLADPDGDLIAITAYATVLRQRSEDSCKVAALQGLRAASSHPPSASAACLMHYCMAREVVLDLVQDANPRVAAAAASALQGLCLPGDEAVVPALTALALRADSPDILLALASICQLGDQKVLEALLARLRNGHWPLRQAALQALAKATPQGCSEVCEAVEACISKDKNVDVRQVAVEVLGSLAQPGDKLVIKFLEDERDEQPFEVQMAIEDALESLSSRAEEAAQQKSETAVEARREAGEEAEPDEKQLEEEARVQAEKEQEQKAQEEFKFKAEERVKVFLAAQEKVQAEMEAQVEAAKELEMKQREDPVINSLHKQAADLKSLFLECDVDKDGYISKDELYAILVELEPTEYRDVESSSLFTQVDTDADGLLKYEEFIDWCFETELISEESKAAVKAEV